MVRHDKDPFPLLAEALSLGLSVQSADGETYRLTSLGQLQVRGQYNTALWWAAEKTVDWLVHVARSLSVEDVEALEDAVEVAREREGTGNG